MTQKSKHTKAAIDAAYERGFADGWRVCTGDKGKSPHRPRLRMTQTGGLSGRRCKYGKVKSGPRKGHCKTKR